MTSKIEKDETKPADKVPQKEGLQIIKNILLLLSPLWVPYAYLGLFWLLDQLLPFKFFVDLRNAIGLIIFCLTPFIATMPIVKHKGIPKLLKVFFVPIYVLFGGLVMVLTVWGACFTFIGRCN